MQLRSSHLLVLAPISKFRSGNLRIAKNTNNTNQKHRVIKIPLVTSHVEQEDLTN
jgi:hypothetical protein